MIKVVSFDIGGTIIKNNLENDNKNYDLKHLSLLVNLDYNSVRVAYKNVFQKSVGTFDELVSQFCRQLKINKTDKLVNFFTAKFDKKNVNSYISNDVLSLIKKIKKLGYKVIFVSNSCCLIESDLGNELLKMLDGVYYSFDLGYTKSDEKLYEIIEKKLNVKKGEVLHIGDTLISDYFKPKENGWEALYYNEKAENIQYDNVVSINSLNEIFKYLK